MKSGEEEEGKEEQKVKKKILSEADKSGLGFFFNEDYL